jgi:hypothetical protein
MNTIIINGAYFLKILKVIEQTPFQSWEIVASKDTLAIGGFRFGCCCQEFESRLYRRALTNLIKTLKRIKEQPITLQFEDNEFFNIKICEMYV